MAKTLSERFRDLSERTTMVRGRGAFGRKPNKGLMDKLQEFGPVTTHHYDPATELTTLNTVQDVGPILKNNVDLYNEDDSWNDDRTLRKVASLPLIMVEKLYRQGINIFDKGDWPRVASLLDSNEWTKFRTAPGTISRTTTRHYITPRQKRRNIKIGRGGMAESE